MRDRIRLPTGGILIAPDSIENPSSDCSRVFSLLPLVACYLASTQCLLKVLALVRPLVDLVKGISPTLAFAAELPKFLKAAEGLVPCELAATTLNVVPFLQDLLCMIIAALNCTTAQLKSLVAVLTGLALQLAAAQAAGNTVLVSAIKSEQAKAQAQAADLTGSIDSIRVVVELAGPMFAAGGLQPLQLPPAPQTDLPALTQFLASLQSSAATLQISADVLGGC